MKLLIYGFIGLYALTGVSCQKKRKKSIVIETNPFKSFEGSFKIGKAHRIDDIDWKPKNPQSYDVKKSIDLGLFLEEEDNTLTVIITPKRELEEEISFFYNNVEGPERLIGVIKLVVKKAKVSGEKVAFNRAETLEEQETPTIEPPEGQEIPTIEPPAEQIEEEPRISVTQQQPVTQEPYEMQQQPETQQQPTSISIDPNSASDNQNNEGLGDDDPNISEGPEANSVDPRARNEKLDEEESVEEEQGASGEKECLFEDDEFNEEEWFSIKNFKQGKRSDFDFISSQITWSALFSRKAKDIYIYFSQYFSSTMDSNTELAKWAPGDDTDTFNKEWMNSFDGLKRCLDGMSSTTLSEEIIDRRLPESILSKLKSISPNRLMKVRLNKLVIDHKIWIKTETDHLVSWRRNEAIPVEEKAYFPSHIAITPHSGWEDEKSIIIRVAGPRSLWKK